MEKRVKMTQVSHSSSVWKLINVSTCMYPPEGSAHLVDGGGTLLHPRVTL